MKIIRNIIFFITSSIILAACSALEYHPYDASITGETGITLKNINIIERDFKGKKSFRFAMISDTQRWYDETKDAVKAINARGDIDFVIHGGDQSDFGATNEFLWMRDIMNKFNMPYFCIIGNHDCLGTGEDCYKKIYGPLNFAFTVGNTRFICLNTNALEYDYSEPVPDFPFIENEHRNLAPEIEKTIFVMHVKPFDDQFNNNVTGVFQYYINQFPGVQFCLYGHNHNLSVSEPFQDGVTYYGCSNIQDRLYLLFNINEKGYTYEVVYY